MQQAVIQTSLFDENVALKAENASLKQENLGLRTELEKTQSRVKHLESYLKWEDRLFSTSSDVLPDAHKIIARALPKLVQEATKQRGTDDQGRARVYRQDVARETGKSEDRAGAGLMGLAESKLIDRELLTIRDKETHAVTDRPLMIGLTDDLKQARFQAIKHHNTGNGQKFFVCKSCKKKITKVRKLFECICTNPDCGDCGVVQTYDLATKEDAAFYVDEETFTHWDEMYGDVQDDQSAIDCTPVDEPPTEPEPLIEPVQEPEPVRLPRRPWACKCGIRSRWIEVNGVSHCTSCEMEYRSYSA